MRGRILRVVAAVGAVVALIVGGTPAQAAGRAHQRQLDPVRAALAGYANFDGAARMADYPTGPVPKVSGPQAGQTCIVDPQGSGVMGEHYVNLANVTDGGIDALRPEALIFEPEANGSRTLVGVEYIVFAGQWDATHHQPPMLFGQKFDYSDASNAYGLPAFYSLHAWLWRANPLGTFAEYNPDVHCWS